MNKDFLSDQILKVLEEEETTYASPMSSEEIGNFLNITPSYIRKKISIMKEKGLVGVRKGPGGGYFISKGMIKNESNN